MIQKKVESLLEKYESRNEECEERFREDSMSLQDNNITQERRDWLNRDLMCVNVEIGTYECIIKDLKELLNEVSR